MRLSKRKKQSELEMINLLDYSLIRSRHRHFNHRVHFEFIACVESFLYDCNEVNTCEKLQTAIARAVLEMISKRAKPRACWYIYHAHIYNF